MWFKTDSAFNQNPFYNRYTKGSKVFTKPLYSYINKKENQYLVVNPWFDIKLSKASTENLVKNGRGILVEGQHGKFSYFSGLQEVQEDAYEYQKNAALDNVALRGHNRTKITTEGIYDYADFVAGLQYQGKLMRYSIGWHPVQVGSGIRPAYISHRNTGFFNYQVGYVSKSEKIQISHGNGVFFGNERLQSKSVSEAGLKRSHINWINVEYHFTKQLSFALHTDANSQLYTDSSQQIRPQIKHYFPIPLVFDNNTNNRLGGEIRYHSKLGKLFAGGLNVGTIYGGISAKKSFPNQFEISLNLQFTKHNGDTLDQIGLFGNNFSSAYSQIDYDCLSLTAIKYQNIRFESSLNYFNTENSEGMNIFASLGYCIHPPSEMLVHFFLEKRQFPNDETYIGIGIRNILGPNRNTY
jgi:hypothetical protein